MGLAPRLSTVQPPACLPSPARPFLPCPALPYRLQLNIHLADDPVRCAWQGAAALAASRALAWDRHRRMVFDVHGVDIEERQIYGDLDTYGDEYRLRRRHERESFRRADVIVVVSHDLENYVNAILVSGGPPVPRPQIEVIPCVLSFSASPGDVEESRKIARERLGLRGRPCVLYLGGTSGWQLPAEKVAAFAELRRTMPSAFLLILTGDIETFTELCREACIPAEDFLIVSCPHNEVTGTACAADVALLLRADNVVNRVASPTKFAEYLSMGVPVVITDVLADFAGIVHDRDVGAVVPASNAPDVVAAAIRDLLLAPVDEQARRGLQSRHAVASLSHGRPLAAPPEPGQQARTDLRLVRSAAAIGHR